MARHALLSAGTKAQWGSINCPRSELRLDLTLGCGQTFRWRETGEGHWTGVMGGRLWTLTQTDHALWYHAYQNQQPGRKRKATDPLESITSEEKFRVKVESDGEASELDSLLKDYFQLDVKLEDLYRTWRAADPHFRSIADVFTGVRMLRQDPTECLFSFICTSNNHISRIQGMVERLCRALGGSALASLDGTSYHHFPPMEALAGVGVEASLRDLGFGYRARFLQQSAQNMVQLHGGAQWLHDLRDVPYLEARDALRTLPGVGVKVADCVCLMSLDKAEAVPVDTHVWQIAKRDYSCSGGGGAKTLTDRVHREIGDFFRQLWGPYAGWAHSVLFCADLKKFQKMKESVSVKEEEEGTRKMKESVSVKEEEEGTRKQEREGTRTQEREGTRTQEREGTRTQEREGTRTQEREGTRTQEREGTRTQEREGTRTQEREGTRTQEREGTRKQEREGTRTQEREGTRKQEREAGETIQKNMKREDKRTVKKERRDRTVKKEKV